MSSNHYAGYSDAYSANALIRMTIDDSELRQGLKATEDVFKKLQMTLFSIGRNMETIGRQLAAPFQAAAKVFADFDDQMRRVAAVTGASAGKLKDMTDVAKQLGASTRYSASQVAGGMGALGMMGFSSKEINEAISKVMDLATVTGTELAEAAAIAANQLRVFHLDASEVGNVSDILAATANGSAQTLTDLGEALKMATPFAAQAGASMQDVSAALGVLANMGIRGSMAGTALAKSYKQMADPKIQQLIRTAYGVDVTDGAGNLRSMANIWAELGKKLASLGNAEQIAAITDIFGDRGALGGGQLTFNSDAVDQFMAKLSNVSGYCAKAAKDMDSGLGGAMKSFKSAVEAVSISIGNGLAPALTILAKAAAKVLMLVAKLFDNFGEAITVLATVSGATLALGVSMKALAVAMSVVGTLDKARLEMLKKMAAIYAKVAEEVWYHCTAYKEAAAANGILSASMVTLKAAALSVGAACKKLWAVVVAHPLAAIAAAAYLAAKAFTYFQDKAADSRIAAAARETEAALKKVRNARELAESSNAGLQSSFDRLRQLADMAEVGTSQQAEYNSIMEQFAKAGINVGAAFDKAGKKISIAANATQLFDEQLVNIQRTQLKDQINRLSSMREKRVTRADSLIKDARWYKANKVTNANEADELLAQAGDLSIEIDSLMQQLEELERGHVAVAPDISRLAEEEQKLADLVSTSVEREIRDNEKLKESALAAADAQIKLQEEKVDAAKKAGEAFKEEEAILNDMVRRRNSLEAGYDARKARILSDDVGGFNVRKDMEARHARRANAAKEKRLDQLKESSPREYASFIGKALADLPAKIDEAARKYEEAVTRAQEASSESGMAISESERAAMEEAQALYQQLQDRQDELQQRMSAGIDAASRTARGASSGSFSAQALSYSLSADQQYRNTVRTYLAGILQSVRESKAVQTRTASNTNTLPLLGTVQ